MTTYARFASILGALAIATTIGVAAQGKSEQAKDNKGATVSGAAKTAGTATKDAAKATGKATASGAKKVGSTTAKGAKATAGGAKKVGVGIKDAVTPDKKDDSKDKKK